MKALSELGFDVPVAGEEAEAAEEKADTFDLAVAMLKKQLANIKPPEGEAQEEDAAPEEVGRLSNIMSAYSSSSVVVR